MVATAQIKTKATLDGKEFQAGITGIKQSVQSLGSGQIKQLGGMIGGAFAAGAIVSFGKELVDNAGKLQDFADSTGVSTDEMQSLSATARKYGADSGFVESKLAKLKDSQESVLNGNGAMAEAFERLGISQKDAVGMELPELLEKIAAGSKNSATSFDDLNTIFGKDAAKQLSGMLGELADKGMGGLIDSAKAAGQVIDADVIAKLDDMGDSIDEVKGRIQTGATELLGWMADKVTDAAAFWGAVSGVGWDEASKQQSEGKIGVEAERAERKKDREAAIKKRKDEAANRAKLLAEKTAAEEKAKIEKQVASDTEKAANEKKKAEEKAASDAEKLAEKEANRIEKIEDKKAQLLERRNEQMTEAQKIGFGQIRATDSLAQYGRYVGRQTQKDTGVFERQIKIMEKTKEIQAEYLAELKKVNANLQGET